jgi:hypothetical protein
MTLLNRECSGEGQQQQGHTPQRAVLGEWRPLVVRAVALGLMAVAADVEVHPLSLARVG